MLGNCLGRRGISSLCDFNEKEVKKMKVLRLIGIILTLIGGILIGIGGIIILSGAAFLGAFSGVSYLILGLGLLLLMLFFLFGKEKAAS
jgi:hypothetical protein